MREPMHAFPGIGNAPQHCVHSLQDGAAAGNHTRTMLNRDNARHMRGYTPQAAKKHDAAASGVAYPLT